MTGLPLKLVVGLGNPGAEYARTRHNAGFWYVDELARSAGGSWRRESRYQCELARIKVADQELWLMKPQTFMNKSGAAVQAVAAFYRITPGEMLVAHDEIDLPPGVVRLKEGGGHGGHNGVRDVIAQLGADFWRLRIGVGHPGSKDQVIDAVLDRATAEEQKLIDAALARAHAALPDLLRDGAQKAMHRLHTRDEPAAAGGTPGEK
jgi:PTH1 family peptidyl-tRNA hydrolase